MMRLDDTSGDWITVESIRVFAHHGTSDAEQDLGQHYDVDVALSVDTARAASSDALSDTVDYRAVVETVLRASTETRVRLVETLTNRIADALLGGFDVNAVRVLVRKLHPPVGSPVRSAGVCVERRR